MEIYKMKQVILHLFSKEKTDEDPRATIKAPFSGGFMTYWTSICGFRQYQSRFESENSIYNLPIIIFATMESEEYEKRCKKCVNSIIAILKNSLSS